MLIRTSSNRINSRAPTRKIKLIGMKSRIDEALLIGIAKISHVYSQPEQTLGPTSQAPFLLAGNPSPNSPCDGFSLEHEHRNP